MNSDSSWDSSLIYKMYEEHTIDTEILEIVLTESGSKYDSQIIFGAQKNNCSLEACYLSQHAVPADIYDNWFIAYSGSNYTNNYVESLAQYAMISLSDNMISLTRPEWKAFANKVEDVLDCSSDIFCMSKNKSCDKVI